MCIQTKSACVAAAPGAEGNRERLSATTLFSCAPHVQSDGQRQAAPHRGAVVDAAQLGARTRKVGAAALRCQHARQRRVAQHNQEVRHALRQRAPGRSWRRQRAASHRRPPARPPAAPQCHAHDLRVLPAGAPTPLVPGFACILASWLCRPVAAGTDPFQHCSPPSYVRALAWNVPLVCETYSRTAEYRRRPSSAASSGPRSPWTRGTA